jgi:hypothetical protein
VYQGDTLRTADLSEAAIYFDDGTSLDVFENSMLKLNFAGPVQELEFMGGAMHFGGSGKSSQAKTVRMGDASIDIAGDSEVSLLGDGTILSVDVTSGSASVRHKDGEAALVGERQELRLDLQSGETTVFDRGIYALEPRQGARLLEVGDGLGALSVRFLAEVSVPSPLAGTRSPTYLLEAARDGDFTQEVQSVAFTPGTPSLMSLETGSWFWRARSSDGEVSSLRRFTLSRTPGVRPLSPKEGASWTYRKKVPEVRFSWTSSDEASAYILELSQDRNMAVDVKRVRTTLTALTQRGLVPGTWYWRVLPVFAHELLREAPQAEIRSLVITQQDAMVPLAPVLPLEGTLYQIQEANASGLSFSWKPQGEATQYRLRLFDSPSPEAQPLEVFDSFRPYAQLSGKDLVKVIRVGNLFWDVAWVDEEGNLSPPKSQTPFGGGRREHSGAPLLPPGGVHHRGLPGG